MFPSNLFITGYEMEGQSIVTRSIIFGLCFYTPSTADENLYNSAPLRIRYVAAAVLPAEAFLANRRELLCP